MDTQVQVVLHRMVNRYRATHHPHKQVTGCHRLNQATEAEVVVEVMVCVHRLPAE